MASKLNEILDAAGDLPTLARSLGERCLEVSEVDWESQPEQAVADAAALMAATEENLKTVSHDSISDCVEAIRRTVSAVATTELLENAVPLAVRAVLRAMCPEVLERYYRHERPSVVLRWGDVYPIPNRRPATHYPLTYSAHNTDRLYPLRGTDFRIWSFPSKSWPSVRLDFGLLDEIDVATYPNGRLPVCTTVHPHEGFEDLDREIEKPLGRFFGVGPTTVDLDTIERQLTAAAAAKATVAVLPEMSLDRSDRLDDLIRRKRADFPLLIVAGSAHDLDTRKNTSVTYFRGSPVVRHEKLRPFEWDDAGQRRAEDLAMGDTLTVLVGRATSLSTVICSDLLHAPIVERLLHAGVNMLLVPALTARMGPFETVAARLATERRGVTLVCNGSVLRAGASPQPFLALGGAPREQGPTRRYDRTSTGDRRCVLRFRPDRMEITRVEVN
jgi:hypothetical protein